MELEGLSHTTQATVNHMHTLSTPSTVITLRLNRTSTAVIYPVM